MRFKTKYKWGDTRIIKRFLLFPKEINGETRWFEVAKYKQRFDLYVPFIFLIPEWTDLKWIN